MAITQLITIMILKTMPTRGSHWKDLNGIDRLGWRLDDVPSTTAEEENGDNDHNHDSYNDFNHK